MVKTFEVYRDNTYLFSVTLNEDHQNFGDVRQDAIDAAKSKSYLRDGEEGRIFLKEDKSARKASMSELPKTWAEKEEG